MAINYRQPQQLDSLSPAYQMLVQAELAKADAMGRVFEPFTKSILANKELAIRREEAAADTAWKQQYGDLQRRGMDINEQELGLKKQEMDAEREGYAAFAQAYLGGSAPDPREVPFQSQGLGGMDARSMIGAGRSSMAPQSRHVDPELAAKMRRPELLMALERHFDLEDERASRHAEAQQKAQADTERRSQYMQTIDRGVKEKWIPETKAAIYRTRANNPQDLDALGKELSEGADKYITDTEDKRSYTEQYKTLRKTIESDKEIDPARKSDLLKQLHAIDIGNMSAKKKSEEIATVYGKAYDPNRTKEKEDKGPFKFLEDDPEIKKGGVIERAPETTKANVKIQAMTMAAQNRMLSPEAMTFMTGAEDYSKIANFYDKLSAVEADTVKRFEDMIWARYGWRPAEEVERDAINRAKAAPKEGLPYNEGIVTERPASKRTPENPSPTQSNPLMDLTPNQRSEALKIHASGDKDALKAFLLKARGSVDMKGSVMETKTNPKRDREMPGRMQ